jgi:Tol biopolymer transport system component
MKRIVVGLGAVAAFGLAMIVAQTDRAETATVVKLPTALGAIHPRLSPDGGSIAFSYQGEIWVAPRTGGVMTLLTPGQGNDVEPAWSPDGKRIAFVRGNTLQAVTAADGKPVPLRNPPQSAGSYAARLEFSADGRQLLGVFRSGAKERRLAWYDPDAGMLRTVAPATTATRFALSPDNKSIVYTTNPDRPGEQQGSDGSFTDLWKVSTSGSPAEKLFRFPGRVSDLCWASTGRALIIAAELGQAHDDLWQVPITDPLAGMRKLTSGQADENRASVSRNGRWLCYTDNRDGSTAIVVRDQSTGAESAVRFTAMDYRRPTGIVRIRIVDGTTGKRAIARVTFKQVSGPARCPPGSLYRSHSGQLHFYCDGTAEFAVPADEYRLHGRRGSEYRGSSQVVRVEAGKTHEVTITLERWVHMAKQGWYSGETHIHANYGFGAWYCTPEAMRQQCVGEDLNVSNFMVANSNADVVYDRSFFRGGPDPLSTKDHILYWNQEFRSTIWGHMTLLNLKQVVEPVFTGFAGTTNPWDTPTNAEIADRTHWQKGVVNYTHVSGTDDLLQGAYNAKALPIDVALGKIDTLDINASWPKSVPLWHRLLNCGFRVHATAGTDCFLNRIESSLPGHNRVYVRLDGPLTYEAWVEGLKAGRSFVTSAPILQFTVDGIEPGGTLKIGDKARVRVKATALSPAPLKKAELFHNGAVIATATVSADGLKATLDRTIDLARGGWLTFSASGTGNAETPTSYLNAHTNPVYIEMGKRLDRSSKDAKQLLDWIDRFEVVLRARGRFPTSRHRAQVLEQIESARNVYRKIIRAGE